MLLEREQRAHDCFDNLSVAVSESRAISEERERERERAASSRLISSSRLTAGSLGNYLTSTRNFKRDVFRDNRIDGCGRKSGRNEVKIPLCCAKTFSPKSNLDINRFLCTFHTLMAKRNVTH